MTATMNKGLSMELEQFVHKEHIEKELEYSRVYRYLSRYIDEDIYSITELNGKETVKQNQTIWMFWMQGMENAPSLIRKCYDSVCKNKPDGFDLVVLSDNNLREYIRLPEFIWEKYRQGYISTTHLSDIIRIELLCTYGGCWIDATVFCSGPIPEYMVNGEMFLFKDTIMSQLVTKMSSWWLCAEKSNRLIHAVRNALYAFWKEEDEIHNYYLLHILMSKLVDEDRGCKEIFGRIPYFNNGAPHILFGRFGWEFTQKDWEILKSSTVIHKLSYKQRFLRGDIYTYYQALMEGRLLAK